MLGDLKFGIQAYSLLYQSRGGKVTKCDQLYYHHLTSNKLCPRVVNSEKEKVNKLKTNKRVIATGIKHSDVPPTGCEGPTLPKNRGFLTRRKCGD